MRYERLLESVMKTALGHLLSPKKSVEITDNEKKLPIVEVLPLNEQQEKAVKCGLQQPLTVVTGPPGTGKSQVVVDILASCAAAGQAVLFASKNNKAVDSFANVFVKSWAKIKIGLFALAAVSEWILVEKI